MPEFRNVKHGRKIDSRLRKRVAQITCVRFFHLRGQCRATIGGNARVIGPRSIARPADP